MNMGLRAMSPRLRRAVGAAMAAGVLAGCAAPQLDPDAVAPGALARAGRFALNVQEFNGQRDAVQGGFVWTDDGRRLTLDLTNPLGNTLARIEVVPGQASLTHSNGDVETAAHPEGLVEQVLGSPMPVSGLRYWLQGRVAPSRVGVVEADADGGPQSFVQGGWRVRLSQYDAQGPLRLQLNRDEARRNISLRLVINPQ